ncbi:MAG: ABC transporter ATP-binding protein [Spirochaetes bacterium]|nr:ABC transporter ATP-binding protein [Spirochaetota bacterium]
MNDILRTEGLSKQFNSRTNPLYGKTFTVNALSDVSVTVAKGETLGVVGESGSGKSTLARLMIGLITPTAGRIYYKDTTVDAMLADHSRAYRKAVQMVFQDPAATLNPRFTIVNLLKEPLAIHNIAPEKERRDHAARVLARVDIGAEALDRYPHEFSGGQRQRIGIARALSVEPEVIILDEPVSALDISIQTQILNLLLRLKDDDNLTYVFISHDLSVIRFVSDRVLVLYLGKVMEYGTTADIFSDPRHPYTKLLLASTYSINGSRAVDIADDISIARNTTGCVFYPRCPRRVPECLHDIPRVDVSSTHASWCTQTNA